MLHTILCDVGVEHNCECCWRYTQRPLQKFAPLAPIVGPAEPCSYSYFFEPQFEAERDAAFTSVACLAFWDGIAQA